MPWAVRRVDRSVAAEVAGRWPGAGEVRVWAVRLNSWQDDPDALYTVLSDEERKRADSFVFARHRRQFVISHAFVRRVLSWYVPARPDEFRFGAGRYGKPVVAGPPAGIGLEFNLSHCAELALLALAAGPVGVDVEGFRADLAGPAVAGHFHPEERRELDALPPDARAAAVQRCWTRKEAVVKAAGTGLATPLDSFRVPLGAAAAAPVAAAGRTWYLTHLEPPAEAVGAVAVAFRPAGVRATLLTGPLFPQVPRRPGLAR
ncbi:MULTISPECIES: 4'-phosphopantetheinyl transferase family protein [Streptomycetaceae]|uniref:Putative 4'-phosphopantetheinyl transferase n=1 Tax=Streptantibioticus cattleyicolor (strain ATCC 35852 / DSM 46488 / JCM 4925 / NBRC 14057 / NRRL 8057) TaxID=1003195 RepID=F8JYE1_STREN|nr:4'-phosphopantetheinyl transferase superfamily protein [Streptantibioticus cattleyicolor]AEW95936.1 putative 4'-phosphopantetheinyl transferase [Streptantibioticus cattleyicolor NRRL 8057 = DSM 46488]MYS60472.1 4'-phosphopantetheinyl transferase superfamily protein [Streptomyces sp. SID5468]CCB76271.1 4'-phosphopantetheinyl transferase [Streptantibioticus cattleyicolor NRRL 8057 = DSM 46488]